MISRRHTLSAALAVVTIAGASRASAVDAVNARAALATDGPIASALDALAQEGRFSGAVLAAMNGAPVLERAWGLADRERGVANTLDTRFNIASAGKMFATVVIGQLLERGALALEDQAARHAPDLPPAIGGVTIARLLSHTSGLGSYFGSPDWAARAGSIRSVNDYLAAVRSEQPQGAGAYRYSNSGYVVLGAIIERITGADYYHVIRDRVFERAGMAKSGYPLASESADDLARGYENGCFGQPPSQCVAREWRRAGWPARGGPAGGGVSTVRDLNAFVEALKGGRLLAPATLELLRAERGRLERPGGPIDAYAMGFGRLTIHGQQTWGHNGGTPGAQAQVDVFNDGLTLIVLSNQDGGQRPASAALRRAAAQA